VKLHWENDEAMTQKEKLVGSDRVLAVLNELARHPAGLGLDEMARAIQSPKPTVHRALASLRRSGLATQDGHGRYVLGDEFLRMAFSYYEAKPDHLIIQPLLERLAAWSSETVHYSVLDGPYVVFRAKAEPPARAIKLVTTIGGRNPAHATAAGKLLLAYNLPTETAVKVWVGKRVLERPTERTKTTVPDLHREFSKIRELGFAIDDQESEPGVNCIAIPTFGLSLSIPTGAISISALEFRVNVEGLKGIIQGMNAIVGMSQANDFRQH
jgi:IclR family acetate operon transcriptional repressor